MPYLHLYTTSTPTVQSLARVPFTQYLPADINGWFVNDAGLITIQQAGVYTISFNVNARSAGLELAFAVEVWDGLSYELIGPAFAGPGPTNPYGDSNVTGNVVTFLSANQKIALVNEGTNVTLRTISAFSGNTLSASLSIARVS